MPEHDLILFNRENKGGKQKGPKHFKEEIK